MHNVTIRFTEGLFYAAMDDSELEGVGDSISEALRDLAENIEMSQI
jgi:hypothetical protein